MSVANNVLCKYRKVTEKGKPGRASPSRKRVCLENYAVTVTAAVVLTVVPSALVSVAVTTASPDATP